MSDINDGATSYATVWSTVIVGCNGCHKRPSADHDVVPRVTKAAVGVATQSSAVFTNEQEVVSITLVQRSPSTVGVAPVDPSDGCEATCVPAVWNGVRRVVVAVWIFHVKHRNTMVCADAARAVCSPQIPVWRRRRWIAKDGHFPEVENSIPSWQRECDVAAQSRKFAHMLDGISTCRCCCSDATRLRSCGRGR